MPVAAVSEDGNVGYSELCAALAADVARNRQIVSDVLSAVAEHRSPVVLSDRREHVEALAQALKERVRHIVLLMGGMGRRQLREARERRAAIPEDESRVILATGSFLGEGFDDARLDTLFLALPVSWRGRLTQFAGRLHRLHDGKREVRIYDYVDMNVAVCVKMSERRARAYAAIGYRMEMPLGADAGWPMSVTLPVIPRWKETFAESVRRLCRDGVNEALANLFIAATLQFDLDEDRILGRASAPGAVAKFLAARLESCDETRRRFQPDGRLPIPCGANPYLEVAFAASREKLAILLDSSRDLADEEAYRRARHEDFLLQKEGYRVLRFLIEDVCSRLDAVWDAIVVSFRK